MSGPTPAASRRIRARLDGGPACGRLLPPALALPSGLALPFALAARPSAAAPLPAPPLPLTTSQCCLVTRPPSNGFRCVLR